MKNKLLFLDLEFEMLKHRETQTDIAKITGLSRASISYKLSGKVEWTLNEIVAICKHYNKTFEELFKKIEE